MWSLKLKSYNCLKWFSIMLPKDDFSWDILSLFLLWLLLLLLKMLQIWNLKLCTYYHLYKQLAMVLICSFLFLNYRISICRASALGSHHLGFSPSLLHLITAHCSTLFRLISWKATLILLISSRLMWKLLESSILQF